MIAVHNHPGYSNCPLCVKRIVELQAELDIRAGVILQLQDALDSVQKAREQEVTMKARYAARAEKAETRVAELEADFRLLATGRQGDMTPQEFAARIALKREGPV